MNTSNHDTMRILSESCQLLRTASARMRAITNPAIPAVKRARVGVYSYINPEQSK